VQLGRDPLGVDETIRQDGEGTGVRRLGDRDAEELVARRADDDVGRTEQPTVRVDVGEPVVDQPIAEHEAEPIQLRRILPRSLPCDRHVEPQTCVDEPLDDGGELGRTLVVLPPLVPEHERPGPPGTSDRVEGSQVGTDREHGGACRHVVDEGGVALVGQPAEERRQRAEPLAAVVVGVEDDQVGGHHRRPVGHGVGEVLAIVCRPREGELVLVHVEHDARAVEGTPGDPEQPGDVGHRRGEHHVERSTLGDGSRQARGEGDVAALHPPLPMDGR